MMELEEHRLSLCDKEFIEKDYEGKEADLLYKVIKKDGQEMEMMTWHLSIISSKHLKTSVRKENSRVL